ncbi:hypothetical protein HER39_01785, partial [Arthrobacter deserti]|nr:hypothetical protein [Arthrobacter deserti]
MRAPFHSSTASGPAVNCAALCPHCIEWRDSSTNDHQARGSIAPSVAAKPAPEGTAPRASERHAVTRSGIVLSNVGPATRPQDDLFRHVNGKWLA